MRKWFQILVAALLLLTLIPSVQAQAPTPPAESVAKHQELVDWLNTEQAKLGQPNQTPGDYQTPQVFLNGVQLNLVESCTLPTPTRDPSLTGDLGANDFVMKAEVVYCRQDNSIKGIAWSPVTSFSTATDTQSMQGFWEVTSQYGIFLASQSFNKTSNPAADPILSDTFVFQAPPNGEIVNLKLTGALKQLPCNNGAQPTTITWPVIVQKTQVIVQKRGDYIEGSIFELWYRNSTKDAWVYFDSRTVAPWDVMELNGVPTGQIDFVLPMQVVSAGFDDIKIVERVDKLPWYVSPVDSNNHRIDGVLYARVDSVNRVATVQYRNKSWRVYIPWAGKPPKDTPTPTPTPTITPTPTPTPTQPPNEDVCPQYKATFYIEGSEVGSFRYAKDGGITGGTINLRSYQALEIRITRGSDFGSEPSAIPNGDSVFTRQNGSFLFSLGRGPFMKVYPSQLPLYETSKFFSSFTAGGVTCSGGKLVYDP